MAAGASGAWAGREEHVAGWTEGGGASSCRRPDCGWRWRIAAMPWCMTVRHGGMMRCAARDFMSPASKLLAHASPRSPGRPVERSSIARVVAQLPRYWRFCRGMD
ncbi:hypothetical protein N5J77_28340 [Sphingobium yanoikuyae]|uniref:Uncharacterized protein n=1 Tax=Sphingobium yanoikuyae TaxID=13690 RepID=A0AA42X2T2_SPHYA|nr:hypothetical protein [Sphingobium yanoikuyae]MDH2135041.1 hypothetical protein [Sphingobium yanoikuyae]MDH2153066.1 hypothetical protein [Sphingobium yanoikuyae]MDH2170407.1 hypothetical protein [Sphingobium yanoikuyae]